MKTSELDSVPIIDANLKTLNSDQKLAYDIVVNHYQEKKTEPLHMIITGGAGCGKSYLIHCLRHTLQNTCMVTAFFGVTAFNINGQTLHSLLQLPIRGKNKHD